MWTIRQDQTEAFRQYHLQKFEDEMVEHSKQFAPPLCKILGDEQVRLVVRSASQRAGAYGFTNIGPIRLFIELTFLCGSAFDTDPQYQGMCEILRSDGDQMARAEQIHLGHLDYLEKVSGPQAINVRDALERLAVMVRSPLNFSSENLVSGLLQETRRIFPKKVAYIGESALSALIQEGSIEAEKYGLVTLRHTVLIVVLMFAFGHGCTNDPLYPWISKTLREEKTGNTRGERLERKATIWLDHVLARNRKRYVS